MAALLPIGEEAARCRRPGDSRRHAFLWRELHERVTDRFIRASDVEGVPAFGLGLALVAAVATLHGSALVFAPRTPGLRSKWRFRRKSPAK